MDNIIKIILIAQAAIFALFALLVYHVLSLEAQIRKLSKDLEEHKKPLEREKISKK